MSNSIANSLTKEKLKFYLRQHNIPLPTSDARKDVYVQLYKNHVLSAQGDGVINGRGTTAGFSSEEDDEIELITTSKRTQSKTAKNVILKKSFIGLGSYTMYTEEDVAALSDADLFAALKDIGAEVGPIVASTRHLYEKRLLQLQHTPVVVAHNLTSVSDSSDAEQEEEEEEAEATPPPAALPATPPRPAVTSLTADYDNFNVNNRNMTRSQGDSSLVSGLRSRKTYTSSSTKSYTSAKTYARKSIHDKSEDADETHDSVTKSMSSTGKSTKRLIPLWMQVAIFFFIAFLIFLIVQNMEPAFRSPFQNTASVSEP